MKLPHRRQVLHLAAGAAALPVVSRIAQAQGYPSRPVRIIVTTAAGSTTDVHGRLHSQWLSERLGQPFIVENRSGGATTLGAAEAIRSRPDGYTLFLLGISHATTPSLYNKLPYNIVHDTSPIALLYQANFVMVVNPSLPVTSVPEFIAYAKANPGKVNMGSQGVGSIGHLAGELFKSMTGIDMVHVPYRSVALALADVVSGQVQVQFATSTDSIPQIRGGQVRALAVSSATRLPALPNVPTVASTCPITHLTAGSALPGRRISRLRSSRSSTGRSMRRSLGQQSRRNTTIWDYASTPGHLRTSASSSPTKRRSGATSSGPSTSRRSEADPLSGRYSITCNGCPGGAARSMSQSLRVLV